jgi:cobaltochelatase CobT
VAKTTSPFETTLTAASRALAGKKALSLVYGANAITLPKLGGSDISVPNAAQSTMRGVADIGALALCYHDPKIHATNRPRDIKNAAVFDALERVRIEAAASLAGVTHNISASLSAYGEQQGFAGISERMDPPVADILAALLREKNFGEAPPPPLTHLIAMWRPWIESKAGDTLLKLVNTNGQKAFSEITKELLTKLALTKDEILSPREGDDFSEDQSIGEQGGEDDAGMEKSPSGLSFSGTDETGDGENAMLAPPSMEGTEEAATIEEEKNAPPKSIPNHPEIMSAGGFTYHAYTTDFDEITYAEKLTSAEELTRLRLLLDQKLLQFPNITGKLTGKLQRLLLARQSRRWVFDLEDGLLHSGRLAQLIVHPNLTTLYKQEEETEFRDTVVTLLIDNSGSMRGRPITVAALSADILARTLERCGVKVEILGFTTRDWKGGEARKHWLAEGKIQNPGRLNDLRHIIYKSADTPYRRARKAMGLMLKDGILKENIDGEAILWAYSRLKERLEERKILMVISDGAPVDDSTLSANSASYLDGHLRSVIHAIEAEKSVELLAIGIGHDVARYYTKAVTIPDVDRLADTMTKELSKLFSEA